MLFSRNDTVVDTVKQFFNLAGSGIGLKHVKGKPSTKAVLGAFKPLKRIVFVLKHILGKRNDSGKPIYPVACNRGKPF